MATLRFAKLDPRSLPEAPNFNFELTLWNSGFSFVAGVDEAGRGALAGPVAAAAMVFPPDPELEFLLHGVRDSKQLTENKRNEWARRLPKMAICFGVGMAGAAEIDEMGIVPATRLAVARALNLLRPAPQHLLVDFLDLPECELPQTALVKGDARSLSIAAASILAKTARDQLLYQLDSRNPGYGFAHNKGYGTRGHQQAIQRLGYSPEHRRSFKIKSIEGGFR